MLVLLSYRRLSYKKKRVIRFPNLKSDKVQVTTISRSFKVAFKFSDSTIKYMRNKLRPNRQTNRLSIKLSKMLPSFCDNGICFQAECFSIWAFEMLIFKFIFLRSYPPSTLNKYFQCLSWTKLTRLTSFFPSSCNFFDSQYKSRYACKLYFYIKNVCVILFM